ncbi:MAG TPA: hypothetical protein VIH28_02375 [Ignavibacteriaceae bacterium]
MNLTLTIVFTSIVSLFVQLKIKTASPSHLQFIIEAVKLAIKKSYIKIKKKKINLCTLGERISEHLKSLGGWMNK